MQQGLPPDHRCNPGHGYLPYALCSICWLVSRLFPRHSNHDYPIAYSEFYCSRSAHSHRGNCHVSSGAYQGRIPILPFPETASVAVTQRRSREGRPIRSSSLKRSSTRSGSERKIISWGRRSLLRLVTGVFAAELDPQRHFVCDRG